MRARSRLSMTLLLLSCGWQSAAAVIADPGLAPRLDAFGDELPPHAIARIGTVRLRHGGHVIALAISADGKTLASASGEEAVLWDLPSGRPLCRLPRSSRIYLDHLAYTRDGKWLIDGAGEGCFLLVREPRTGEVIRRLRLHETARPVVWKMVFSRHDADLVAVHFMYEEERERRWGIGVWTLAEGRELFHAAPWYQAGAIYFGDGLRPMSLLYLKPPERAQDDYVWFRRDLNTGEVEPAEAPAAYKPADPPPRFVISNDGNTFATSDPRMDAAAQHGVIRVRRGRPDSPHLGEPLNPRGEHDLDSLPPPNTLGTLPRTEFAFDREGKKIVFTLHAERIEPRRFAFRAADGKFAEGAAPEPFTNSPSIEVRQHWNSLELRRGEAELGVWNWRGEGDSLSSFMPDITASTASPNGAFAAAAGWKRNESGSRAAVKVWDVENSRIAFNSEAPEVNAEPGAIAFSPDGRLFACSEHNRVLVVDTETWKVSRLFSGHHGGVHALAFSPDSKRLASWSRDHACLIWSIGDEDADSP